MTAHASAIFHEVWLALGFLTTLPAPQVEYHPGGLSQAGRWFPLVGLLLAALLVGAAWLLGPWFSSLVAATLVVLLWVGFTGGLHLDGLADCCDGLLASVSRQRRLEILRDPRLGSFGVIGLVLALILKIAAIATLAAPLPALVLAPVWARWLVLLAARQPPARPGGLGDAFGAGLSPAILVQALVVPALVIAWAGWLDWRTWPALALAALACYAVIRLARARIGGVTGDVFGAVVELGELAVLLAFAVR